MAVDVIREHQQFFWRQGGDWQPLGDDLPSHYISDEGGRGPEHSSFTGAFVGMVAFDTTGSGKEARFSRFAYHPKST